MKRLGKFILAEFITSQAIIHTHLIILPNLLENVGIEKVKTFSQLLFAILKILQIRNYEPSCARRYSESKGNT